LSFFQGGRLGVSRGSILLAVLAGALCALAFPPLPLYAVVFVGPLPLLLVIRRMAGGRGAPPAGSARHAALLAYVAGVAFFGGTLYWIANVRSNTVSIPWLMAVSMVASVLYVAAYWAVFGALLHVALRRLRLPLWVAAPPLWVACEYLRSLSELGFPWSYLGTALAGSIPLLQTASLLGVWGMSFHAVLVSAVLHRVAVTRGGWRRRATALAALLLLLVPWFWGRSVAERDLGEPDLYVGVAQPNVDTRVKWERGRRSVSFDALMEVSESLAAASPDLVVWPETSVPCYPSADPGCLGWIRLAARDLGTYLLAGYPELAGVTERGVQRYHNRVGLYDPNGERQGRYAKRRLVPFSEAMPYEDVIPGFDRIELGQSDFTPGPWRTVFDMGGRRFGVLICYEIIFPGQCRDLVRRGAGFLVNVTNDAWFGRTSAPYQHAQMAQVRAAETRVWVVRSANTGISLFADPHGRIVQHLPLDEAGGLLQEIRSRPEGETLYLKVGDILPRVCLALAGLVAGAGLAGAARDRRRRA
jgi:apolipoprotein N-acyltransferase